MILKSISSSWQNILTILPHLIQLTGGQVPRYGHGHPTWCKVGSFLQELTWLLYNILVCGRQLVDVEELHCEVDDKHNHAGDTVPTEHILRTWKQNTQPFI